MIPHALRFRRFSLRVLSLLLGLLFAVLATTYQVVSSRNQSNALANASARLEVTAHMLRAAVGQRIDSLVVNAQVLTGDYAFKQAFSDGDRPTLSSALVSFAGRVRAPVITLYDSDGKFITANDPDLDAENAGPFSLLIREAIAQDLTQHSGLSFLKSKLHVLVVVPFYAPYPNIFGWFGLAFPIDRDFAWKIRELNGVELTYLSLPNPDPPRVLATTLPVGAIPAVSRTAATANHSRQDRRARSFTEIIPLPDDDYVSLIKFQPMLGGAPVALVLQLPLSPELAPAKELADHLILTSLAALAAASLLALVIARSVSQPVRQLAAHTEKIAAGDYATRLTVDRADELGQLAGAMNQMSAGLAERDLVRDLLDKNVSPEIAAQLLRDGSALGGELRDVTILFADLRGFTTLSEKLPPQELLALLNRYLDRMSAAIESKGGVIDKFIGDAIMALFGAPIAQGDAADRALAAALAMERALVTLNAELAAEGIAPLAIGIGVNTARVVAGNIGSHRRLNYSVIGDGVNLAARLQAETRKAEYRTNLITSAATLAAAQDRTQFTARPLGSVQVKGRAQPVEIFAVGD